MTEVYYKPNEIRFSRQQIIWLIPLLPLLRSGSYPRDPKESGYTDAPIGKRQIKAKAPFIMAVEIASELDYRIQQTGWHGLMLEMVYSADTQDRLSVVQHIAMALAEDTNYVEKRITRALRYIRGAGRKKYKYSGIK